MGACVRGLISSPSGADPGEERSPALSLLHSASPPPRPGMGRRGDVQGDAENSSRLPWRDCSPVEHLWGRSWEIPCGSSRASIFLTCMSQEGHQAAVMFSGRAWLLLSATSIFHPKLAHFKLKYVKIFQHFNQRENPCKGTGHGDPRGEDRRGACAGPWKDWVAVCHPHKWRLGDVPGASKGGGAGMNSACLPSKPVTPRGRQPGTEPARREGRTSPARMEPAAPRARADPRWPSASVSPWPEL